VATPSALTVTAKSADRLVEVTVGAHGELRSLRLDPRVHRVRESLADTIKHTVRTAAETASRKAFTALLPDADPDTGDTGFGPVLHELDRAGYTAFRADLVALQEVVRAVVESAESDDGLVTATVDGRGLLLDLELDPRIFRDTNARLLADQVTTTVARAAELAAARVAAAARRRLTVRGCRVERE
jgi:DNA-binding protein YbaB